MGSPKNCGEKNADLMVGVFSQAIEMPTIFYL